MSLVPHRFLFRVAYPCRHVKKMPHAGERPPARPARPCRIDNFAAMDGQTNFADVRSGLERAGPRLAGGGARQGQAAAGRREPAALSDGVTLWLDTRDARASHRASRYCHQFHFLPAGGGAGTRRAGLGARRRSTAPSRMPRSPAPGSVPFRVSSDQERLHCSRHSCPRPS